MERRRLALFGTSTRQLGRSPRLSQLAAVPSYRPRDWKQHRGALAAILLLTLGVAVLAGLLEFARRPALAQPANISSDAAAPEPLAEASVLVSAEPESEAAALEPAAPQAEVVSPPAAAAVPPLVVRPAPAPTGSRLRIPGIGVDAPMITLALAANGQMPAPPDDSSVAWYDFSAAPGGPGNAMLAGHVDWVDHAAVFWHLRTVTPGDSINVTSGGQTFLYVVDRVYYVPFNLADTSSIVGRRTGPPTLTIVTCAGTFDSARHLYDQRLVVVSSLRS